MEERDSQTRSLVPLRSTSVLGSADAPPSEAERKLMKAILQDAIECWQACAVTALTWRFEGFDHQTVAGKRQRLFFEADFWFFHHYDNAPYFSFEMVCEYLGIEPEFIRRGLREWLESQIKI